MVDRKRREPRPKTYDSKVIKIARVTKVTKGGRQNHFSVAVVVGNKKGKVGIAIAKSKEVPMAIKKAERIAVKNMVEIPIVNNSTIPHEVIGHEGASKVLLKPAFKGTGVKAGGAVRDVLELAGIKDILSKSLGSNNSLNIARATISALANQRTKEQIAKLRGIEIEEV